MSDVMSCLMSCLIYKNFHGPRTILSERNVLWVGGLKVSLVLALVKNQDFGLDLDLDQAEQLNLNRQDVSGLALHNQLVLLRRVSSRESYKHMVLVMLIFINELLQYKSTTQLLMC